VPRSPTTSPRRSARISLSVLHSLTLWSPTSSPGSAARRMSRLVSSTMFWSGSYVGNYSALLLPWLPVLPISGD
jgi:hypothetical protein